MSILSQLLTTLLEHNSSPAATERVVVLNEEFDFPCRAYYTEHNGQVSYETAAGSQIVNKQIYAGHYHPIKVKKFTGAVDADGNELKIYALW